MTDCPYCTNSGSENQIKDHIVENHQDELPRFAETTNCPSDNCGGLVKSGDLQCSNGCDHAHYLAGIAVGANKNTNVELKI